MRSRGTQLAIQSLTSARCDENAIRFDARARRGGLLDGDRYRDAALVGGKFPRGPGKLDPDRDRVRHPSAGGPDRFCTEHGDAASSARAPGYGGGSRAAACELALAVPVLGTRLQVVSGAGSA